MKKSILIYLVIVSGIFLLSGCSSQSKVNIITLKNKFNEEKARELLVKGYNSIIGSALIRQNGGGIVTCAGNSVYLVPFTKYAEERFNHIYGDKNQGYTRGNNIEFFPNSLEYLSLIKKTVCNADGFFKFNNLSNGSFFITTKVDWRIGNRIQGGTLMQKVQLSNNETKEIVLTP